MNEIVSGEPPKHVRAPVPLDGAQATFQLMYLFAVSSLSQLRTVPLSIAHEPSRSYRALVEWAPASAIDGDGVVTVGLTTPEEEADGA